MAKAGTKVPAQVWKAMVRAVTLAAPVTMKAAVILMKKVTNNPLMKARMRKVTVGTAATAATTLMTTTRAKMATVRVVTTVSR